MLLCATEQWVGPPGRKYTGKARREFTPESPARRQVEWGKV